MAPANFTSAVFTHAEFQKGIEIFREGLKAFLSLSFPPLSSFEIVILKPFLEFRNLFYFFSAIQIIRTNSLAHVFCFFFHILWPLMTLLVRIWFIRVFPFSSSGIDKVAMVTSLRFQILLDVQAPARHQSIFLVPKWLC